MGSSAAVKHARQFSRQAERLMRRQAKNPTPEQEGKAEHLDRLSRSQATQTAKTARISVTLPETPAHIEAALVAAQRLNDGQGFERALPAIDRLAHAASLDVEKSVRGDDELDPRMRSRLLQPLHDAAYRAHVQSKADYGPEVAIVVRVDRPRLLGSVLIASTTDVVVTGRLSAVQRLFPDGMTRGAWERAGVDVYQTEQPLRMEIA